MTCEDTKTLKYTLHILQPQISGGNTHNQLLVLLILFSLTSGSTVNTSAWDICCLLISSVLLFIFDQIFHHTNCTDIFAGPGPFPAMLDLWGLGGGLVEYRSALFASRGYASLSLAYLGHKELPGSQNSMNVGDSYFRVRKDPSFTLFFTIFISLYTIRHSFKMSHFFISQPSIYFKIILKSVRTELASSVSPLESIWLFGWPLGQMWKYVCSSLSFIFKSTFDHLVLKKITPVFFRMSIYRNEYTVYQAIESSLRNLLRTISP